MKPLMPFAIRASRALFTGALFLYFAFALTAAPAFADDASGVTHIFKPDGTPTRAIFDYTMQVTVASPNPVLLVYWRSLALTPLFISLFALNQWLKRRSVKGGKR